MSTREIIAELPRTVAELRAVEQRIVELTARQTSGVGSGLRTERVAGHLILSGPRVVRQAEVEAILAEFLRDEAPAFIPCDRHALDSPATASPRKTTDIYLATAHGWQLATLDEGIAHPAADLIPRLTDQP
jgi:hypothetical protein